MSNSISGSDILRSHSVLIPSLRPKAVTDLVQDLVNSQMHTAYKRQAAYTRLLCYICASKK